jgi:hypothetical protein
MAKKPARNNGDYLATCDNDHLTRKNAGYHLVIWNGQLWRERFQVSGFERRGIIGREGRKPSSRKEAICSKEQNPLNPWESAQL